MAGVIERDEKNKRVCTMWEECGIQFRANIVAADGLIPLHVHDYPHVALVTEGAFDVVEITPSGERREYIVAAKQHPDSAASVGYRVSIPAWHQHTFVPRGERGEVLCVWPS